ncbi:hypothetical protein KAU11_02865, partial [Candidatus Babeliales bacterium]|nr:hypothetical protein [Candidatus Babeliales bacterium]
VKSGIKSLENQGFIIKDRIQRVEELRLKKLEQLQSGKKEEQVEIEEEKEVQLSWTDRAYNFIVNVVARVYSGTKSFFGSQDEIKKTSVQKIKQKSVVAMPSAPVETVPVETAPVETAPVKTVPVEIASVPELPVEMPLPQMPPTSGMMPPAMPQNSGMGMPPAPSMGMQ